jgi:hypothetical protein
MALSLAVGCPEIAIFHSRASWRDEQRNPATVAVAQQTGYADPGKMEDWAIRF